MKIFSVLRRVLIYFNLSILLFSCNRAHRIEDTFVVEIMKGQHYSTMALYDKWDGEAVHYTVVFLDNCVYDLNNENDQLDWNKVFGFSFNGQDNHDYSMRFGWRWSIENQRIEFGPHMYIDGEKLYLGSEKEIIGFVGMNEAVDLLISPIATGFEFVINGVVVYTQEVSVRSGGRMLGPYFGGQYSAPHDMTLIMHRQ